MFYRGYDDLSVKRVCLEGIPDEPAFINVEGDVMDGFTDKTENLQLIRTSNLKFNDEFRILMFFLI